MSYENQSNSLAISVADAISSRRGKLSTDFTFDPNLKTVTVNDADFIQFIYIANETKNVVLFQPSLQGAGGVIVGSTITLEARTNGMSSNDTLIVVYEATELDSDTVVDIGTGLDALLAETLAQGITLDSTLTELLAQGVVQDNVLTELLAQGVTLDSTLTEILAQGITLDSLLTEQAAQGLSLDALVTEQASQGTAIDSLLTESLDQGGTLDAIETEQAAQGLELGSQGVALDGIFTETTAQGVTLDTINLNTAEGRDFLIEVKKGNVPGHSLVHKFGRNDAVPNGSWVHISLTPFAAANFLQAASTVRIKAGGNVADTAAGAGAREVTVQGIDDSFAEVSEAIATAGASASTATTALFWRVHRQWVSAVGTYTGANTAAVLVEATTGPVDLITIGADEGQSQYCGWTVPAGKTAYLLSMHINVDSNKTANIRVFTRDNIDDVSAPMPSKRLKLFFDGIEGSFRYDPNSPNTSAAAKSDFWVEAYGDGAVSHVTCDFELLVVDD